MHWVSWKKICKPLSGGGLGVVDLNLTNRALLGKWVWKFANEKDSIWKKFFCCKHNVSCHSLDITKALSHKDSWIWRGIVNNFSKNDFIGGLKDIKLIESLEDCLLWDGLGDGLFSVKECRKSLDSVYEDTFQWRNCVWLGLVPPRVETFLWQLSHQKLLSWSDLRPSSVIWKFIPGVVLWSIWRIRNEIIFDNGKLDKLSLFFTVRLRLARWFLAKYPLSYIKVDSLIGDPSLADSISAPKELHRSGCGWIPPPVDFFKFNVDGACSRVGRVAGIGVFSGIGIGLHSSLFQKMLVLLIPISRIESCTLFLLPLVGSYLMEKINLKDVDEYKYLKQSNCYSITGVDDAEQFRIVQEALDAVHVSKEDQESVFAMLAVVLWLGNVSFTMIDNENHVEAVEDESLINVAKLIGCDIADLSLVLSTRKMRVGNDNIVQKLTLSQYDILVLKGVPRACLGARHRQALKMAHAWGEASYKRRALGARRCASMTFDDLIIFCGASKMQILNVKRVLRVFEVMSGLQLNLKKSRLFGTNTIEEEVEEWARAIGCSIGCFPSDYLGLPLGANRNSSALWDPGDWSPPPKGFIKLNVDVATSGDWKRSGIGGILRDDAGSIIGSFHEASGLGSPTLMELKAVQKGLSFFDSFRGCIKGRLIIESDSKAIETRDALAKSIYACLFEWLVEQINKSLAVGKRLTGRSISILDIYGFESFNRNSFEQFCINYANERLQQHFNRHLFKLEQEEYIQDGIDWTKVDFDDNQDCLRLFEKKPLGLLSLLNEESTFPNGTDYTFASKLKQHLNSNPCFRGEREKAFTVSHFAGEVTYDTTGFLEKNRDLLHLDSIQLLSSSSGRLPQVFASNMLNQSEKPVVGPLHKAGGADSQKLSVATKFKQLRCCGVLEVVRISRSGFPTRMSHQKFARRYGFLLVENAAAQEPLSVSVAILHQFNILPEMYQVGYTKLFFRTGQIGVLEDTRNNTLHGILRVQSCFRGYRARCHFKELQRGITTLQSFVRGEKTRKEYAVLLRIHRAAVIIQKQIKGRNAKRTFNNISDASIVIQSAIRGCLVRRCSGDIGFKSGVPKASESDEVLVKSSFLAELQRHVLKAEAALREKEEENDILHQRLLQYESRWSEYELKMKSMEEVWQKQMRSLQSSLSIAKKSLAVDESQRSSDASVNTSDDRDYCWDAGSNVKVPVSNGLRPMSAGLSVISRLAEEFEQRSQVFGDDAKFLVEVKSGQVDASLNPDRELRRLKQMFETWKKDYAGRLRETKVVLNKLGSEEGAFDKVKKFWGRRNSTRYN
ncbi:Myosin-3 [Hibiscus syriacus]|uniref:Myosin-3 n=1 Tax=Hibiscus syriacus TaxID=106335 RepID=A0A6A3D030_HIBSY|nr:Myosin-3 [Hibiscus syriacus]